MCVTTEGQHRLIPRCISSPNQVEGFLHHHQLSLLLYHSGIRHGNWYIFSSDFSAVNIEKSNSLEKLSELCKYAMIGAAVKRKYLHLFKSLDLCEGPYMCASFCAIALSEGPHSATLEEAVHSTL